MAAASAAAVIAGELVAAQPASAQAGPAYAVECSAAALAAAIRDAPAGAVLELSAGCDYRLSAPLPDITKDLTLAGNGASISREPTAAPGGWGLLTIRHASDHALAVAVDGVSFVDGDSAGCGAAISISGVPGDRLVLDADGFTQNRAVGNGGAICVGAGSRVQVNSCTFAKNTSAAFGGGVYVALGAILDLRGTTFTDNTAPLGGGAIANRGTVSADHVTFRSNEANAHTYAGGGAIQSDDGTVTVIHSSITANTASYGGGIYFSAPLSDTTRLAVSDTTISGNLANNGGGIFAGSNFRTDVVIVNSEIVRNTATSLGGGLFVALPDPPKVGATTVRDNQPDNCFPPGEIPGCHG